MPLLNYCISYCLEYLHDFYCISHINQYFSSESNRYLYTHKSEIAFFSCFS